MLYSNSNILYLGSVSVSGKETWVAWWWGWWGWAKEEWGDIMDETLEEWLYMLGWLSCEWAPCGPSDIGKLDMAPFIESETPLCGLPSISRPLMLGWSIWKHKYQDKWCMAEIESLTWSSPISGPPWSTTRANSCSNLRNTMLLSLFWWGSHGRKHRWMEARVDRGAQMANVARRDALFPFD